MKFDFYADPGHGWVKVTMKLIKELKIENDISHYSYQKGDNVYLEEDGDLAKFLKAMKKADKLVEFREYHINESSKIRNYACYQKDRA